MQHVIKKQVINLSLDKNMDAFNVQHIVSEHYWRRVIPVLQKVFDAASSEDEVLLLDKLEIDLGTVHLKDIEKGSWEEVVFKKTTERLSVAASQISVKERTIKQSVSLNTARQWLFYMQHGYLSWAVLKIDQHWYEKVLQAFAGDSAAISNLRDLIQKDQNAARRIIFQHPETFLKALIETLTAEKQELLPKIIEEVTEVVAFIMQGSKNIPLLKKEDLSHRLWQRVFQLAVSGRKDFNSVKLASMLLQENIPNPGTVEKLPGDFLSPNRLTAPILKEIKETPINEEKANEKNKISEGDLLSIDNAIKIDEEGIFVQHAGMVLLHPFLNMFFKNLQLVDDEKFVNTASHQKAIYLLHYMVTGKTDQQEYELVIAKILCAYPLEEPVHNHIELTAEELSEAEQLLIEVISQWEILKGTSIAGLREGFLQRNGKLYAKDNGMHLQVESNSIDVLLDSLPWSISIIMLHWMNDILKVEWR